MFKVIHNSLGQVDAVYTIDRHGIEIPLEFNPQNKTFDETHALTIALREWEASKGTLDLSDRPTNALTLQQAKQLKKQEIIQIAITKQEELVAGFAPPEQASWGRKVADAKAFLETGIIQDACMLKPEAIAICQSDVETTVWAYVNALALKVLEKSEQLYSASAQIAGTRTRINAQIDSASTFEQLNLISWN